MSLQPKCNTLFITSMRSNGRVNMLLVYFSSSLWHCIDKKKSKRKVQRCFVGIRRAKGARLRGIGPRGRVTARWTARCVWTDLTGLDRKLAPRTWGNENPLFPSILTLLLLFLQFLLSPRPWSFAVQQKLPANKLCNGLHQMNYRSLLFNLDWVWKLSLVYCECGGCRVSHSAINVFSYYLRSGFFFLQKWLRLGQCKIRKMQTLN